MNNPETIPERNNIIILYEELENPTKEDIKIEVRLPIIGGIIKSPYFGIHIGNKSYTFFTQTEQDRIIIDKVLLTLPNEPSNAIAGDKASVILTELLKQYPEIIAAVLNPNERNRQYLNSYPQYQEVMEQIQKLIQELTKTDKKE